VKNSVDDYDFATISITDVASAPIDVWHDQWWPGITDPAVIGDLADPDGDGASNLFEYATGSNPTFASTQGQPVVQVAGDRLEITFTRARQASDVIYRVEGSNDLVTWSEIWNSTSIPYNSDDETQVMTISDNVSLANPANSLRFLHLRISK
jgi:hypothetical protein